MKFKKVQKSFSQICDLIPTLLGKSHMKFATEKDNYHKQIVSLNLSKPHFVLAISGDRDLRSCTVSVVIAGVSSSTIRDPKLEFSVPKLHVWCL